MLRAEGGSGSTLTPARYAARRGDYATLRSFLNKGFRGEEDEDGDELSDSEASDMLPPSRGELERAARIERYAANYDALRKKHTDEQLQSMTLFTPENPDKET